MYKQFKPIAELQPFVHCIWTMKGDAVAVPRPERLVPDGHIELMLNYGGPFLQSASENTVAKSFKGSRLVGQRSSYYFTSAAGLIDVISISFKPGGLSPFVKGPVADLTNATVSLDELDNPVFSEMEEKVWNVNTLEEKISQIQQLLLRGLRANYSRVETLVRLMPAVQMINGYGSVARFLKEHVIHERKLQREFDHHIGVSPKFLQRVLRFRSALNSFYQPRDSSLTSLAYDCGYYDQAHFINEFKFFSGLTPRQYIKDCQAGFSEIWMEE